MAMEKITLTYVSPPSQLLHFPSSGNLAMATAEQNHTVELLKITTLTGYFHEFRAYLLLWIEDLITDVEISINTQDLYTLRDKRMQIRQARWLALSLNLMYEHERLERLDELIGTRIWSINQKLSSTTPSSNK